MIRHCWTQHHSTHLRFKRSRYTLFLQTTKTILMLIHAKQIEVLTADRPTKKKISGSYVSCLRFLVFTHLFLSMHWIYYHIPVAGFFRDPNRLFFTVAYCPFELWQSADGGRNGASKRILPTFINPRRPAVCTCALWHAYHVQTSSENVAAFINCNIL